MVTIYDFKQLSYGYSLAQQKLRNNIKKAQKDEETHMVGASPTIQFRRGIK